MSRIVTALGASSVQSLKDTVRAERTRVQKGPMDPVANYQAPGAILSVTTLESIKGAKPPTIFSGRAQLLQPNLQALMDGDLQLDEGGSAFPDGSAVEIKLWNQSRFPVPKGETVVAKRDARGLWVCEYTPPAGHILVQNCHTHRMEKKAVCGIDYPVLTSPAYGRVLTATVTIEQDCIPGQQYQQQRIAFDGVPSFGNFRLKALSVSTGEWCYSGFKSGTAGTDQVSQAIDELVECLYSSGATGSQSIISGDIQDMLVEFSGSVVGALGVPLIHVESQLRSGLLDGASLSQLQDGVTIYSAQKAQARHGNRIGVVLQELMPDEVGYAAVTANVRTFFFNQHPLHAGDSQLDIPALLAAETVDAGYRHLGIPTANWISDSIDPTNRNAGTETDYTPGEDGWGIRDRPNWLLPIPRWSAADSNDNPAWNSPLPYDAARSATSLGRASAISGVRVDDISCVGVGEAVCSNSRWVQGDNSCEDSCSLWPLIEGTASASEWGMVLPCVDGDIIQDVRCVPSFPFKAPAVDVEYATGRVDIPGYYAAQGAMVNYEGNLGHWVFGEIALGVPQQSSDSHEVGAFSGSSTICREIPELDEGEDRARAVRFCCAQLTCTYHCDRGILAWDRARGTSPYNLTEWVETPPGIGPQTITAQCVCPDFIIADRAGFELPCNETSTPSEYTLGMVYSSTESTTSTTETTDTTTAEPTGACCWSGPHATNGGLGPTINVHDCTELTENACLGISGVWSLGASCEDIGLSCHIGACCGPDGSCSSPQSEYACLESDAYMYPPGSHQFTLGATCGGGFTCPPPVRGACCATIFGSMTCLDNGTEAECLATAENKPNPGVYHQGQYCIDVDCGETSTTTGSTSDTTTGSTTGSTSDTTTGSTTGSTSDTTTGSTSTPTTAEPTGACCVPVLGGGSSCLIKTQSECEALSGATYQGDGSTCSPDPCGGSSSTSGSSTGSTSDTTTSVTSGSTSTPTTQACGGVDAHLVCQYDGMTWGWVETLDCATGGAPPGCDYAHGGYPDCSSANNGQVLSIPCTM